MISKKVFEEKFKNMPPKRKQVLEALMSGKTDEEIRDNVLNVYDLSTVRRHISNIYKDFDLKADGLNYRCNLVELVHDYKPELVSKEKLRECGWLSTKPSDAKSLDEGDYYIERPPIEARCYEEIVRAGALIRIKAPKLMGKTLLSNKILAHAKKLGYRGIYLNLNELTFTDLDTFLQSFCLRVGQKLDLPNELKNYWDELYSSSKINCTTYFEQYLLESLDSNLVLCLDEVDRVFPYGEIAPEFLALLRSWHEDGRFDDIWKKLRLIVVHSTEVYVKLPTNQSPFNVGVPIELPEFSLEQVKDFAQRYGLNLSVASLTEMMDMVGGHPYLWEQAFDHLKNHPDAENKLEQLLLLAPTEEGIYGRHLHSLLNSVQEHPELLEAVTSLVSKTNPVCVDSNITRKLESIGLVKRHGNDCSLRFNLYRQYFSARIL